MRLLFELDEKNYSEDMPLLEKYAVRAIIRKGDKFAMQLGSDGEYKIPGGMMEPGESHPEALYREVMEETGLVLDLATQKEIGEVCERRRDMKCDTQVYVCHSLYYLCDITDKTVEPQRTESEILKGYQLSWATLEEILAANHSRQLDPWVKRDTLFLEWFERSMYHE